MYRYIRWYVIQNHVLCTRTRANRDDRNIIITIVIIYIIKVYNIISYRYVRRTKKKATRPTFLQRRKNPIRFSIFGCIIYIVITVQTVSLLTSSNALIVEYSYYYNNSTYIYIYRYTLCRSSGTTIKMIMRPRHKSFEFRPEDKFDPRSSWCTHPYLERSRCARTHTHT